MAYRLLVLEDDQNLRESLVDCLTEQGYEVVAVGRGKDAVLEASSQVFDLFISDIRMDGITGLDAIEQAKGHQPALSSMVVSGYCSEAETLRAIELNVGAYLQKPFSMQDFLARVSELLAKRSEQQRFSLQAMQLQKVVTWALDTLVAVVDETALVAPVGTLQGISRLAKEMCAELELSPETTEQVRLSAQFAALSRHPKICLPSWVGENGTVMVELKTLVEKITSDQCDNEPAKIARFALEKLREEELSPSEMSERHGVKICEVYDRVVPRLSRPQASEEIMRGLGDPQKIVRSLLALGRMLEQSGDSSSALNAFEEISTRAPQSWESVQAQLGLARLASRAGRSESAEGYAIAAYQQAQSLGPLAAARACLESGLVMAKMNAPLAQSALERACGVLNQMGQVGMEARARLALATVRSERDQDLSGYVRILLEPANAAEVADSVDWVLPILFERGSQLGDLQASLSRLAVDQSHQIGSLLQGGKFPLSARRAMLQVLAGSNFSTPASISESLVNDPDPQLRQDAVRLLSGQQQAVAPPLARFLSMGFFQCFRGAELVSEAEYRSQKAKYMLAFLAASPGKPVSDELLVEEFWPDAGARGMKNLNSTIFRLRNCLRGEEKDLGFDYIVRTKASVELNREAPRWHDFEELESALARGQKAQQAGQVEQAIQQYRRCSSLYGGPYLDGCFMEWAVRRRSGLEERMGGGLCELAKLLYQTKNFAEALEASTRALDLDQANQVAQALKLRALVASGKPEVAIRHYEKAERFMRQEFELEPSMEMIEIYQRARYGLSAE